MTTPNLKCKQRILDQSLRILEPPPKPLETVVDSSNENKQKLSIMKTLKTLIALLAIIFSGSIMAQQFNDTEDYRLVMDIQTDKEVEYESTMFLTDYNDPSQKLVPFTVYPEELSQATVSVLQETGLQGINEIIKVELEYEGCGVYVEKHYFLVKDNGFWTSLPVVDNYYYEGPTTYNDYIFPTQEFGKLGQIVKAEFQLDKNYKIETIQAQQSFSFLDDTTPSDGITATFE